MFKLSDMDYSGVPEKYRADCKTICEACFRAGTFITPEEAYKAWGNYSEACAAGWLGLPDESNVNYR
jgi:hypothetical protein